VPRVRAQRFALHFLYVLLLRSFCFCFFFHDPAPTEIYTLSLHDALPISGVAAGSRTPGSDGRRPGEHPCRVRGGDLRWRAGDRRSEEHTSELQSRENLVCRLLLEKKKSNNSTRHLYSREYCYKYNRNSKR